MCEDIISGLEAPPFSPGNRGENVFPLVPSAGTEGWKHPQNSYMKIGGGQVVHVYESHMSSLEVKKALCLGVIYRFM